MCRLAGSTGISQGPCAALSLVASGGTTESHGIARLVRWPWAVVVASMACDGHALVGSPAL